MNTNPTVRVLLAIVAVTGLLGACSASRGGEQRRLTLLSYNVQNLFDGVYDGSEYPSFDPRDGVWDENAAEAKAERVARVVRSAVDGGPDVLCLQEVENARVVSLLASESLSKLGFGHAAVTDAVDSAVQVAILSRYRIRDARVHAVGPSLGAGGGTGPQRRSASRLRPVLEVHLDVDGASLRVFSNHWKSKREGAAVTEPSRRAAAAVIARRVREIEAQYPRADIVVCGDLNEEPSEYERVDGAYRTALMPAKVLGTGLGMGEDHGRSLYLSSDPAVVVSEAGAREAVVLYSPWSDRHAPGSYFFRGRWRRLDHTLVSGALFDGSGFSYASFSVVRPAFAVSADGRPKRSLRPGEPGWDTSAAQGYSDHFPVLLTLERGTR